MDQWYERLAARIGLRMAGLALLVSAWCEGARVEAMVAANPSAEASPAQMLLAALMFASASAGLLLTFLGAGLWRPVAVSDRWTTRDPKTGPLP